MNRKVFLKTTHKGLIYSSVSLSLLSCILDDYFDTENTNEEKPNLKKRFKPIYIISEAG